MLVLLLEDEYPAAERLQRVLRQAAPDAQVAAVLDSVAGALQWLEQNPAPDLILSDIQLADGLSLEVFEQTVVRSPVIFTTAYDAYAIRAFKANSVDYLLKPVKLAELTAALTKLREWRTLTPAAPAAAPDSAQRLERLLDSLPRPARQYKTRFLVRQGEQLLPLPATQVAWFQSRHETTTLATQDGRRFVIDYTLEQLEQLLDPRQFFRLNRQFLAQLPAVQRLHPHFNGKLKLDLHPAPTDEVLVSREKATALKQWLEEL
ncbi:LytR/AlgR family response regulator transcription factor [Hymenobacter weizhouensis]|uniref:LytR/AlgR family response regulator transcription factor n=1 Tax=Hymenobacter sp. YIM 151500-1 TaxID=2987689 RepID=UPI0022260909|nr:LytTR family DNA-binding domain-containing protein [Hymenobacter sp. YIM 151500-1]UYZ63527.1 LytTR family DNA-binding domain-containing protein [Hymenobacter sp. YIM 151500-1]